MKLISFLFISFLTFAQSPYSDTLQLRDDRYFPCFVKFIDEDKVEILYGRNTNITTVLEATKEIKIKDLGLVYSFQNGFLIEPKVIRNFLEERNERIEEEKLIKEEAEKFSDQVNSDSSSLQIRSPESNKWAFGILYIPYSTTTIYTTIVDYYSQLSDIYIRSTNESIIDAEISYGVSNNFRILFDLNYTSTFTETRNELHVRTEPSYIGDQGSLSVSGLKLFDLNLGFKYYLHNFIKNKVTAYFTAAIGKQFAFAEEKDETLFLINPPTTVSENNNEEYREELYSPWHFNIGFGAEYFFNESLSLNSNIRFIYSKVSAKFESRERSEFESRTRSEDYTHSDFITRIGIGFNFYF